MKRLMLTVWPLMTTSEAPGARLTTLPETVTAGAPGVMVWVPIMRRSSEEELAPAPPGEPSGAGTGARVRPRARPLMVIAGAERATVRPLMTKRLSLLPPLGPLAAGAPGARLMVEPAKEMPDAPGVRVWEPITRAVPEGARLTRVPLMVMADAPAVMVWPAMTMLLGPDGPEVIVWPLTTTAPLAPAALAVMPGAWLSGTVWLPITSAEPEVARLTTVPETVTPEPPAVKVCEPMTMLPAAEGATIEALPPSPLRIKEPYPDEAALAVAGGAGASETAMPDTVTAEDPATRVWDPMTRLPGEVVPLPSFFVASWEGALPAEFCAGVCWAATGEAGCCDPPGFEVTFGAEFVAGGVEGGGDDPFALPAGVGPAAWELELCT